MTRHILLNITQVKQIVPRSQIWSYGSSVSQRVQSSYSWHKARHKGNPASARGYGRAGSWGIRGSAFQVFGQMAEFWSCENIRIVLLPFYYFYSSSGIKYSATEFIQNLLPVGCGPSSNTCPRCEPQVSRTSILSSKSPLSFRSTSASSDIGAKKLGQPVPESYFCSDLKSGLSQPTL